LTTFDNYPNIATTCHYHPLPKSLRWASPTRSKSSTLSGFFDLSGLSKQMVSKRISSTGCRKMCRKLHVAEPCCGIKQAMLSFDMLNQFGADSKTCSWNFEVDPQLQRRFISTTLHIEQVQ